MPYISIGPTWYLEICSYLLLSRIPTRQILGRRFDISYLDYHREYYMAREDTCFITYQNYTQRSRQVLIGTLKPGTLAACTTLHNYASCPQHQGIWSLYYSTSVTNHHRWLHTLPSGNNTFISSFATLTHDDESLVRLKLRPIICIVHFKIVKLIP